MNLEKYSLELMKWVEKQLQASESDIRKEYQKLVKRILVDLSELFEKYEKDGQLTYAELAKYNRLTDFLKQIERQIGATSLELSVVLTGLLSAVYVRSYYYTGWSVQKESLKPLNYRTIKQNQIKRAIDNPVRGLTLTETLEKQRRDIIYTIRQTVTQSVVKGVTYKEMASELKERFEGDYKKAIRVARTETHRVREQGTLDSARYAASKGVQMLKKWRNMKDSRVRKTSKANHVQMDHKLIPVEDMFDLGGGKQGIAPGNTGYAEHDINCRCILVYEIGTVTGNVDKTLGNQLFNTFEKELVAV